MCDLFNRMKKLFIIRFNRKPVVQRVTGILRWSIVLILSALLLGGHYLLAAVFATLVALIFLSIVLVCKKVEETNIHSMVDNCTYAAQRTVDIMMGRIKDMAQSDSAKKEQESYEACRSAILCTQKVVVGMENVLDTVQARLEEQNSMLKDYVLPELGIFISDSEDEWVQCDVLGSDIPYGLISLRISNRLRSVGINTFADLVLCNDHDVLSIPDFGPSSLERVKQLLSLMGLHLGMTIKNEDGIWYYKREEPDCMVSDMDEPLSAEDEILAEENDSEERV